MADKDALVRALMGQAGYELPAREASLIPQGTVLNMMGMTGDPTTGNAGVSGNDPRFYLQPNDAPTNKAYAREAYDNVWPSHQTLNELGVPEGVRDQLGRIQSAALSGANSLGFGLPMALAQAYAPDAAARAKTIMDGHSTEKNVAGLAAAIGNPANTVFRAGGNALAQRGFGTGAQAAADIATAAAVHSAPNLISGGPVNPALGSIAGAAGASRYMMPSLSSNVVSRAAPGAVGGAVGGAFDAFNGNLLSPIAGALIGAMYGGGLKRSRSEPPMDAAVAAKNREKYGDATWMGLTGMIGAHLPGWLSGSNKSPPDQGLSLP